MAKPSVTNIRPPVQPPVTDWNSGNITTDSHFAVQGDSKFDSMTGSINYGGTDYSCGDNTTSVGDDLLAFYNGYDYVFFASNGGSNEIVDVSSGDLAGKAGIIVTGDGKDTIHGGDLGDLIFAGNGMDKVWGGGGDDIIYGENGPDELHGDAGNDILDGGNGPDQLFGDAGEDWLSGGEGDDHLEGGANNDVLMGDAGNDTLIGGEDDGTFSFSDGSVTLKDDVKVYTGDTDLQLPNYILSAGSGEYEAKEVNPGHNAYSTYVDNIETLQKEGLFIDSGHVFEVFAFSPKEHPSSGEPTIFDPPPPGGNTAGVYADDTIDISVVLYSDGFGSILDSGNAHWDLSLKESELADFAIDLTEFSDGGHVAIFLGKFEDLSSTDLDHASAALKTQAFDTLSDVADVTSGGLELTPGDELCGGAGTDAFVWKMGDGVDVIHDYDQGNTGLYDVTEGDVLQLYLDEGTTVHNTTDNDGNLVIYFQDSGSNVIANSAIVLDNIDNISQVTLQIYNNI